MTDSHASSTTGASQGDEDRPAGRTSRRSFVKAAGAGAGSLALGAGVQTGFGQSGATQYNLAEAFQKSVYLYDANECGTDVAETSELDWRGDCHEHDAEIPLDAPVDQSGTNLSSSFVDQYRDVLDPEGTGTIDVAGGYHDAGDHVKFGQPGVYSASTIAWAVDEFEDAFRDVGSYEQVLGHLRRFAEYYRKCTFRDDAGDVVAFCHQVSDGGSSYDHNYWGPAELQTTDVSTRPAWFATLDDPAHNVTAGAAAALAAIATVFEGEDSAFAADCVDTARALYEFADQMDGVNDDANGYYSTSMGKGYIAWAGIWLHEATGEDQYLSDVLGEDGGGNFTGHVSSFVGSRSESWRFTWVHCWNDVRGGVLLKLGELTDDDFWWDLARWHLAFWSGGDVEHEGGGQYLETTPAGFSWLNRWGSARYNAAAQFEAMVYHSHRDEQAIADWALGQMEYIMGDSPIGYSLIVGFTDDYASHPHHDTAHGSLSGSPSEPLEHRHTLWGALVGGPDANDNHEDATDNYVLNEVAIDFNAGLVGALAGLYSEYGPNGDPVAAFPPDHEDEDPYYVEAMVDRETGTRIDVKSYLTNVSFYPPESEDGLSFRYFLDCSAMEAAGEDPASIEVSLTYDQIGSQYEESTTVTGPVSWPEQDGIYYVEFDASGHDLHGEREISFGIAHYTADGFDPSNDPSREGLSSERTVAQNVGVYLDGDHVFGTLPDGTTPPEDVETPTARPPTEPPTEPPTDEPPSGTPPAWPDGTQPGDPNDDGVFEDLNGNERVDSDDVVVYFENYDESHMADDAGYYDLNGNGRTDADDVVVLFESL